MCHHCVELYSRHRRRSMEHYYCCRLSHADSLHHHVDQNSNRVRYSTDDLVRTSEKPTCPLERCLKLLNRWCQRTDMLPIHLNSTAKPVRVMTIALNMDLRNLKSAAWPSNATLRCSSSWQFLVRQSCDDDTSNKDSLVSYKDTVHPHPMILMNSIRRPL